MQYFKLKENIASYFKGVEKMPKRELVCKVRGDFPDFADNTINAYLSRLKKEGVLHTVSRGVYKIESLKSYQPFVSEFLKNTYDKIKDKFPYIDFCVGETAWLNDYMVHLPFKNYTYIEIEKEAINSVFNFLSKQSDTKTFLYSDKEFIDRYLTDNVEIIIVKPLVSEAPLTEVSGVRVPTLEKLLVDVLIDKELFSAQQSEKRDIFLNAISRYNVNKPKMRRYAQRRNRKEELDGLINISLAKNPDNCR